MDRKFGAWTSGSNADRVGNSFSSATAKAALRRQESLI
jgi:hypothetical protein